MNLINSFIKFPAGGEFIDDANTLLLLHFNGTDGQTTTTDSATAGSAPHTITLNGDAQLDTAIKKYGSASLLLDGTGDYASIPDNADFYFNDPKTVECQIYLPSLPTGGQNWAFMSNSDPDVGTDGWTLRIYESGGNVYFNFVGKYSGGYHPTLQSANVTATGWHHIAIQRDGNDWSMLVDSVVEDTEINSTVVNSFGDLYIGQEHAPTTNEFPGSVDEVRISNIVRY